LLLLGGLLIINHNLAKNIWQPFYTTLGRLQNYKVSDAEPLLLDDSTVDEFNDLKQSLLQLTNRSQLAYQGQKEFTENASHEMQTPLAILQAKLELLMQTSPLNKDQALLIGEMADASQRMARLGKSLLLLTKIENKQFPVNEKIELEPILRRLIQQYEPLADQKKITLQYNFKSQAVIDANKSLIEVMIANLLGNAIRHNHAEGTIQITLEQDRLNIRNTGVSSELNDQKIFNRFQKDSTDANSLGLGLEIVKKICELYNFRVNYSMAGNLHNFEVQFA
jgi:signal transduction histidine kinase